MQQLPLRGKITAFLLFVGVLQTAIVFLAAQFLILPHFEKLQEDESNRSFRQLESAITTHIEGLSLFTLDWAAWTDTYDFIVSRDADYIDSNLVWESFADNDLNVIAMYDTDGVIVWGKTYDLATKAHLPIAEIPIAEKARLQTPRLLAGIREHQFGIMQTSAGPFLVVAHPILTSQNEGPSRGVLIMARRVDTHFERRIGEQIHLPVEIRSITSEEAGSDTESTIEIPRYRVLANGKLEGSATLSDMERQPVLELKAELSRSIYDAGAELVWYSLALLVLTMLALLGAAWCAIRRTVTEPIAELASKAKRALPHGDPKEFWIEPAGDEISNLSNDVAEMLGSLAAARERLAEHSFNIGMARMASGALHTANNGFTGFLLKIDGTIEKLDLLKGGDRLSDLIEELAWGDISDERRQAIRRYADTYAKTLNMARDDAVVALEGLSEHARQVSKLLSYQTEISRSPIELRPASWRDLVARALEIIPDGTLSDVRIELDDSVQDATQILAFPPGIVQIIIEITNNAIESCSQASIDNPSLKFYCGWNDDREYYSLYLSDNGAGLNGRSPAELYSINYSTKSTERSGFGLNWCAMLMQDMGGRMTLEDRGDGVGMTVSLQLKAVEAS